MTLFGFPMRVDPSVPARTVVFVSEACGEGRSLSFRDDELMATPDVVLPRLEAMVRELEEAIADSRDLRNREITRRFDAAFSQFGSVFAMPMPEMRWLMPEDPDGIAAPFEPPPFEPPKGIKMIFHPAGRFEAPDGRKFDYVFPEFRRDPSLPPKVIVPEEIFDGVIFRGRVSGGRPHERVCIGERITGGGIVMPRSGNVDLTTQAQ